MIILRVLVLKLLLFSSLLLAFFGGPAAAQMPGAVPNVPATLQSETAAPAPGQALTVAFVMKPKPGWHGYFENPGDAGFGMQLDWDLPQGVTAGKPRYPVPETLIISGLMNYVYERPYAVLVDLQIAPSITRGAKLPIKVRADWLACTDKICVPEGDDLSIDLVTGQGLVAANTRAHFDTYRAALPAILDRPAQFASANKGIEIAIPFPANAKVDQPYFFALTPDVIDYAAPQMARRIGDMLIIKTNTLNGAPASISGVFRYGEGQGLIVTAKPGLVPAGGIPIANKAETSASNKDLPLSFGWVLIFSVLGGLILNLMPCVFPILGLKALSLAKMGGDGRAAKRDALAYSGGVIISVLALGGVMLMLRSAGQLTGWAFQLQEPRIVMLLLLVMTAVTVNLAGGYEIASFNGGGAVSKKEGMAGSFWTGVLAAVVATPCTGPFMAAAMGAALLMPAAMALLVFAGLGFGLALPYLAIAYIPLLRGWLPKPGPWLSRFKYAMAVPMALTAAALLWLLWRLSGSYGLILGTIAAAAVAATLLMMGKVQRHGRAGGLLAGVALVSAAAAIFILPRSAVLTESIPNSPLHAQTYSETRLAEYRRAGRPVFVYFTADWCVTCKVNEAAAIDRPATAAAFAKNGVKVLVGDFTRRDPDISRALAVHGRSGVPLYIYYPKGGEARILPQILTPQIMADLVK